MRIWHAIGLVAVPAILSACQPPLTIRFEKQAPPPSTETGDESGASFNCFEASTAAEHLVCTTAPLAALDLDMGRALHRDLRKADLFARDLLLAQQRAWLESLPAQCSLGAGTPPASAASCLEDAYRGRIASLAAWRPAATDAPGLQAAIRTYVTFKPIMQADPPLCAAIASAAQSALDPTGAPDPARFSGGEEIAGTHGPAAAQAGGHAYAIAQQDTNVFGGYATRASALTADGKPVLTSLSVGELVRAQDANRGGRFSAFASQTGDYAAIDVFRLDGRLLAMATDPIGYYAPATAGEFAHAAVWSLQADTPTPTCLFETTRMPPEHGAFDTLPAFSAWRAALQAIAAASVSDPGETIGVTALRDQSQLRANTEWMLLNMPLVVRAQATTGNWNSWLRHRHDQVLETLLTFSKLDEAHAHLFRQAFDTLHPAAQDLVATFQQTQGLTAEEAKQAGAIAIMEMLYGSVTAMPGAIGNTADASSSAPRYGILEEPK